MTNCRRRLPPNRARIRSCSWNESATFSSKRSAQRMHAGLCVDQLRVDSRPILVALQRPFQHVAYAELLAQLLCIDVLVLECESRIAGDDRRVMDAGKIAREIVGDGVGEAVLAGIIRKVLE